MPSFDQDAAIVLVRLEERVQSLQEVVNELRTLMKSFNAELFIEQIQRLQRDLEQTNVDHKEVETRVDKLITEVAELKSGGLGQQAKWKFFAQLAPGILAVLIALAAFLNGGKAPSTVVDASREIAVPPPPAMITPGKE